MLPEKPLTLDEFRAQVLERFRQPVRAVTEKDLVAMLDEGLFSQFRAMAEYCDQIRLIATALFEAAPVGDQDNLDQMMIDVDRVFQKYCQSILEFPRAAIQPGKSS